MEKRICIWVLILGLAGSSAWADLVGYWPLDGGVATDLSGNGNHGIISGSVSATTDRDGNPDSAMYFAGGSGDKIDVGNPPEFNLTGAMTITAWVYVDSTSHVHGGRNARILAKMGGGGQRSWSSSMEASRDGVPFTAAMDICSNGNTVKILYDDASIPLDQWVHYACVYTPGTRMEVFLDGDSAIFTTTGVPASQYSNNGLPVLIGNRNSCGDCGWYGALDEVRLYNEALSEGEIEALMGLFTATNPDPPDEALHVGPTSVLSWDAPPSAPSPVYDVYLGTDPNFAGEAPVSDDQSGVSYDPNPDLQFATKYYWQIVVDDTHEGPIWSFTTQGLASDPAPEDGAINIDNIGTMLSWTGESAAVSYDIFLGTSESAVAAAGRLFSDINQDGSSDLLDLEVLCAQWLTSPSGPDPNADLDGSGFVNLADYAILAAPNPIYKGNQLSTTFNPGTLNLDTTYYWRIDEVFPGGTPKGSVWDFTTWAGSGNKDLGEKNGVMWEYLEWNLVNPSWSGNPFDLVATVTFTHTPSGSTHTTEMFYDGSNTWKFRFTGAKTGEWTFTTVSSDPELNGYYGTAVVAANPDPDIKGFLTNVGNKYAIMDEDIDDLEGYVYEVFMNQQDFEQQYKHSSRILGDPSRTNLIDDYWDNTRDNGFNIYFYAVFYSWFRMGALSINDFSGNSDPDLDQPDLDLFNSLELAIQYAHERGGRTHIWAWGDNDRSQTPNHLGDGFRGARHQRLIRYIAARLGPLCGWSMNFGFDTIEMPNAEADCAWWADKMNQTMGWSHILTSRGWDNASFGAHSYSGFGGGYELTTTDKGPADYAEIKQDLEGRTNKPHIYEERHTYNRWACWPGSVPDPDRLNETGSRRLIWWEVMAGGMGGFFGHFSERFNEYGPFNPAGPCGYHPESLKRAFRTYREFWKDGRLKFNMSPDNSRVSGATGYCLAAADNEHFVFFVEDAASVTIDLSGMPGSQSVIAVDAKADYAEIDKGSLTAGSHLITLGSTSDWAIAVGDFD